jgi:hypothetical protein
MCIATILTLTSLFWAVPDVEFSGEARAESPEELSERKDQYDLFHPVPPDLMRELSADRPDKTESPFTVDAGHFQLEMDFANFSDDRHNVERADVRVRAHEFAPLNLKLGILNNVDAQLVLSPYRWEKSEDKRTGTIERHSGFGDITPRLKFNLVGNDGGPFALALLPFVKLPANQDSLGNTAVEGGLKVPYWFDVPDWDVCLMAEVDIIRDALGSAYHPEFVNSISIGHHLIGKFSLYAEFFSSVSAEPDSAWIGTFDTWLTYAATKNLRFEGGVYMGVTRSAEDLRPFIGMTWRY